MSSRRPDELCGRVSGGGAVGCLVAGAAASDSGIGTRCARMSADDNTISLPSSSDRSGEKSTAAVGAGEVGRIGTHRRASGVGDLELAFWFWLGVGATSRWENRAVGLTERLLGGAMSSVG